MIRPYFPWPAALIKNREKTIVVSDLHLGFEAELVRMGINLPSQTYKIEANLTKLIEETRPDRLIILGDLKHGIPVVSLLERLDLPRFIEKISEKVPVELILGNHDGGISRLAKKDLTIRSSRGLLMEGNDKIGLFHGHTWPAQKLFEARYWIVGHIHPAIQFRGLFGFKTIKPIWLKVRLDSEKIVKGFLKNRNIEVEHGDAAETLYKKFGVKVGCTNMIIMPAFNEMLGGLALNAITHDELLGPILRNAAAELETSEVILTDGTFLGELKDLKRFS
ncbi:MAG: metallophosphoesterase [Candidatus Bathyarchaeia archaeon]